jgi:hypothetical protein
MATHSVADKCGLVGNSFAIWNTWLGVQHMEAELWQRLIGNIEQGVWSRKVARGDDAWIARKIG